MAKKIWTKYWPKKSFDWNNDKQVFIRPLRSRKMNNFFYPQTEQIYKHSSSHWSRARDNLKMIQEG